MTSLAAAAAVYAGSTAAVKVYAGVTEVWTAEGEPPAPTGVQHIASAVAAVGTASARVTVPSTVEAGDLLVIGCSATASSGSWINGALAAVGAPGVTFTKITSAVNGVSRAMSFWWAEWPDGTSRDVTINGDTLGTSSNGRAFCSVLRGADLADPIGTLSAPASVASNLEQAAPSLADILAGSVSFAAIMTNDDNTLTGPAESGWELIASANVGSTLAVAFALKEHEAAGSSGTATFTQTTNGPDAGFVCAFAINPEPTP